MTATKIFGCPFPFREPPPASRVHVQLFDLHAGGTWVPGFDDFLHEKKILLPQSNPALWHFLTPEWAFRFHWRQHRWVLGVPQVDHRVHLNVRYRIDASMAFDFYFCFLRQNQLKNQLTVATGNFCYGGHAVLSVDWGD